MDTKLIKVLLIEDDEDDYCLVRDILSDIKGWQYDLEWVNTYEAGLKAICRLEHDICLADYCLGEKTGVDLLSETVSRGCRMPIILLTGQGGHDVDVEAMNAGAADFLIKGNIDSDRIERSIRYAIAHRRAESELKQSEMRYQDLYENAPDMYGSVSAATARIVTCNQTLATATGYRKDEIIGRLIFDMYHPDSAAGARQAFDNFVNTGEVRDSELQLMRKDGSKIEVSLNVSALRDEEGRVIQSRSVWRDITERKRAEEGLRKAKAAAEAADNAKSEFLANMSHEIRTPMTAIKGFSEVLREEIRCCTVCPEHGPCEQRRRNEEFIGTVCRNGEYLLGIVNDILDLSKIEVEKLEVERIATSPLQIIAEVASLSRVPADAKGLPIHIEYVGSIPKTVQTDPTRLRQILLNVMANAIKFTEVGGVRLVTRLVDDADERYVQFDVIDTGMGMTEKQVAASFQPFVQADSSTTRKFGGTGLGLVISKRLAGLLGGDVELVETQSGIGTRFRITVATGPLDDVEMIDDPTSAASVAPQASATGVDSVRQELRNCRILLAEDGPDNQRLIGHVLRKAGAEVTIVGHGKLAVDAALAARDEGKIFDVILMDIQMPVMDGYNATRLLRKEGYTGIIIALTAHAMEGDREKCMQAGCDEYETKPIDRNKLVKNIQAKLEPAAARVSS